MTVNWQLIAFSWCCIQRVLVLLVFCRCFISFLISRKERHSSLLQWRLYRVKSERGITNKMTYWQTWQVTSDCSPPVKIWSMMQLQWLGLLAFFPLSSPGGMQTQVQKSKTLQGNRQLSWTVSLVTLTMQTYSANSQRQNRDLKMFLHWRKNKTTARKI